MSSAQSENLASRVADRLATQMMLSQTFSRWPFSDFELEELAEAPGGLELVLPRTQTVMSDLPLDREGSKVYQTYAVGALEASLKTSDLIELRVDEMSRRLAATAKQRVERAAETNAKRVEFNNKLAEMRAVEIALAARAADQTEFKQLLTLRERTKSRIQALFTKQPDLLESFDDPAKVPAEVTKSRQQVRQLLEKAKGQASR